MKSPCRPKRPQEKKSHERVRSLVRGGDDPDGLKGHPELIVQHNSIATWGCARVTLHPVFVVLDEIKPSGDVREFLY